MDCICMPGLKTLEGVCLVQRSVISRLRSEFVLRAFEFNSSTTRRAVITHSGFTTGCR